MDAIRGFLSDLKSPDPSIRFSVLSRIEDLTFGDEEKQALQEFLTTEADPGIRFHIQKMLARIAGSENRHSSAAEIEALLKSSGYDDLALALMLEAMNRSDAPLVAMALREANWPEFSACLLPSVLKFFKKYGSFEDASSIEQFCRHHDPRVLSSAVEALEKICPDRLKDLIVPLLVNSNSGVRSRAVRLLYRWDPSEALRHFEAMLFSNAENEKHAALFHSFFFPFRDIETLMLRFLSIENNLELIEKAGLVFMANPDRQIPARLLEARQASTGAKFKKIDAILCGVLESLFKAGIVNAEPSRMLELLENHYREKRIRQAVERYDIALKSGETEVKIKVAEKLCELARHNIAEARELLAQYLARETDLELKNRILQMFRAPAGSGIVVPVEPVTEVTSEAKARVLSQKDSPPLSPKKLLELDEEGRQHYFDSISSDNFAAFTGLLRESFFKLSVSEQIAAVKIVERLGRSSESELIVRFLNSENPELLTAAIDCLSAINPEALHPFLPQLIKHRFDEVRLSAIRVFALFDKKQAISLLEKMLFSIKPVQRRNAIFCLASFDFHSVSQLLLTALKNESDPENIQQISSTIRSNADQELLCRIYSDRKNCRPGQKEFYDELFTALAKILAELHDCSCESLIKKAEEKYARETAVNSVRASYQLEKIQKIRQNASNNTVFDASLVRFTMAAYFVGAVITALVWFLFLAPGDNVDSPGPAPVKVARPARSFSVTVQGRISEIDTVSRKVVITDDSDKSYEVVLPSDFGQLPSVGQKFHAQLRVLSVEGKRSLAELLTAF